MLLKTLYLQNFRNFSNKELALGSGVVVIVGPNAAGKTNILEAIYLLATGRSLRAGVEQEMVCEGEDLARVVGAVEGQDGEQRLEVVLTRGQINGSKVAYKKLSVNGSVKRLYNFAGILKSVIFGPGDVGLVTGSPSLRRRFLDGVLSQVDREYYRSLLSYEKGVRQRNKLLVRIKEGIARRPQLLFWDQLLIKNGEYLTKMRSEFIEFMNNTDPLDHEKVFLEYDKSIISPARLEQYAQEEILAGSTLVGPHRDDIKFRTYNRESATADKHTTKEATGGKDLAVYGSRGEQRMGVLWLKLGEVQFIEAKAGVRPILLLDDIFSELDDAHREIVMRTVNKQQTIMTTADPHIIEEWREKALIIEVKDSLLVT